ncbi:MAG: trypsin-like peptidase domain-containing protein [Chloroflexi bacterium]|nr:trypsin-like peptidase domain-containing protein [Chloroflexota bacterium]
MSKNTKTTLITCGVITLVVICVGAVVLLGGFGALLAFSDDTVATEAPVNAPPVNAPQESSSENSTAPAKLYESVVQIIAVVEVDGERLEGWSGSGSIISADGLILTNAHVVLSDKFYDVEDLVVAFTVDPNYPAEPKYYAEVMQVDEGLDLAVIRVVADMNGTPVDYATLNLPAVPLGNSDALELGGDLTIMGYPGIGGVTITLTSGDVGGFTAEDGVGQRAFIKTSATISGGNSGGLAVNSNNELIGVPTQLGYGGNDQFVDCRVLADTNRDGVVDDFDNCVPTGGFINALRPIKLALPLIDAAKRGEVSFVEKTGPAPVVQEQPAGSMIFEDDFSSASSGWSEQNTDSGSSGYQNGQYVIDVREANYSVWGNNDTQYSDVIVSADVQVLQSANGTGGMGIMCRYVDNNNYYQLEVDEDGYFIIYKYLNGEFIALYDWDNLSSLVNKGAMNISASCIGNELTLSVDNQIIARVVDSDASFSQGFVGLAGGVFDDPGLIIGFDNLKVYTP